MNKPALRDKILAHLRAELALQVGAARLARDEAISEESRPENQYDTHSLEAGYLAEGQARLAAEIEESIAIFSVLAVPDFAPGAPAALGAHVETEASGRFFHYFLAPRGGGLEIAGDEGVTVLVVTPQSPLGRQLLGRRVGDIIIAGRAGAAQQIVAVR